MSANPFATGEAAEEIIDAVLKVATAAAAAAIASALLDDEANP